MAILSVNLFCVIFCGCVCIGSALPVIDLTGKAVPISETLVENEALAQGEPIPQSEQALAELVSEHNTTGNGTIKDLYVIRAVVYEIGILTDVPENETYTGSNDTEVINERVDLTFFNAHKNDTHLDLGSIPLPVQTNVSGQVLTGIAPINIGAVDVDHPEDILETLPITGTIVNITKSESSMFVINTDNVTFDQLNTYLDEDDLTKIPVVSNVIPAVEKLETSNIPLSEALSDLL
uniref:Uncharacterized protein n=1 Tax=Lutzomyia longipalpis TaxID=7200 RepID=A0A1B0CPZ0_LUTLO